jgi:hypothetical protein
MSIKIYLNGTLKTEVPVSSEFSPELVKRELEALDPIYKKATYTREGDNLYFTLNQATLG